MNESPLDFVSVPEANRRHDQQHGNPYHWPSIRTSWKGSAIRGRPLTDEAIAKYSERGFYSAEYREARKAHAERRKQRRDGNFEIIDGRFIYRP